MKRFMTLLTAALVLASCTTMMQAQIAVSSGTATKFSPSILSIPAGGSAILTLANPLLKPVDWKCGTLPAGVAVTPLSGTMPATSKTAVTVKLTAKLATRVVIPIVTITGDKLAIPVEMVAGSDIASVAPMVTLYPTEGTSLDGKPVKCEIRNGSPTEVKWKAGTLPTGIKVLPAYGIIPAKGMTIVEIAPTMMTTAGSRTVLIPFLVGTATLNFKFTQTTGGGAAVPIPR